MLAATLVLFMVASAFPLAQVLLPDGSVSTPGSGSPSSTDANGGPAASANAGRVPFGPDPAATPATDDGTDAPGGSSSRPWASGADARTSGSALLDEVLGAAQAMGYSPTIPDLPLAELAPLDPLRPAILAWIAATGAPADPEELARELARADAMPQALQRDLAILVLSAAKATLLQQQALARIPEPDQAWVLTHPEVAEQLAEGVANDDTRRLARLAALVDVERSIEASLLMLQAVEATRGSLASPAASSAVAALDAPDLDPAARAMLDALRRAATPMSDEEKVRFAADLVAASSGVTAPAPEGDVSFPDAVQRLLDATGQVPDAAALQKALDTAALLPEDLQLALAKPLLAQAAAVRAADPAYWTEDGQARALVGLLYAIADALPTLEKYSLYWSQAPDALRVGQWDPTARAGWALEHAALLAATRGDLVDLARAGGVLHGIDPQDADVPARSFEDAYFAVLAQAGVQRSPELERVARIAADSLDPRVRDAAARMLSGVAESARLQRVAFQALTPDEKAFLLQTDTDALFAKRDVTSAELATLARASALAAKVDQAKLAQAQVVGVRATLEARDILAAGYAVQGDARPYGFFDFITSLLPWRDARAQGGCVDLPDGIAAFASNDCQNDVLLVLKNPLLTLTQTIPREADPVGLRSLGFGQTQELLVLLGPGSSNLEPGATRRPDLSKPSTCQTTGPATVCAPVITDANAAGGAHVLIDLGGSDTYVRPVAATHPLEIVPVSLHLDMGGNDNYADPTNQYVDGDFIWYGFGTNDGIPTQASAIGGGVAVLLDQGGNDRYEAQEYSQGYGQWGLGLLADLAGDDEYVGGAFTQGASSREGAPSVGILYDATGDDGYTSAAGQGYGLGGLLLDTSGDDTYLNDHAPQGVPIVHLAVLPGGDLTALDRRDDDITWLDGPGELNLGIGVDMDPLSGDTDSDGFTDFAEFLAGTDSEDPESNPVDSPTARVDAILLDGDDDTFPDFIERALSSDPANGADYPAGFPRGPTFVLPAGLGRVNLGETLGGVGAEDAPQGQDKIVDLRLPFQDAGSVDFACFGEGPIGGSLTNPRIQGNNSGVVSTFQVGDTTNAGQGTPPQGPCVPFGYETTGDGEARVTTPNNQNSFLNETGAANPDPGQPKAQRFKNFTLKMPAGILAIGDAVPTTYDVDYFFVLDIGGDDVFENNAGGALVVSTTPRDGTSPQIGGNSTFVAPSLVLNVDLGEAREQNVAGYSVKVENEGDALGDDVYRPRVNETGDFAQGSLLGVLVDTAGNDRYTAGGGSQGALGGVLLDLAGTDRYVARDLSQGASLATQANADRMRGAPAAPNDKLESDGNNDAALRAVLPGLLLDLGDADDTYVAGNHSQGFARGFPGKNGALSAGILLDQGGDERYDTNRTRGANSQGVGHYQGIGILFDVAGSDRYEAWGAVSQGAPMSQTYNTAPADDHSRPGAGILVDLAADDTYLYSDALGLHNRTSARENNLTLTRTDVYSGTEHAIAGPGVHLDTQDAQTLPGALLGVGRANVTSVQEGGADAETFYVNIPTAKLAIGGAADTTYAMQYALVIDLGGQNTYAYNAGGLVGDVLLRRDAAAASNPYAPRLALFPVSLLVDAGNGASTYTAERGFAQGAGLFSVGVVVDLGGADSFVTLPERVPSLGLDWMPTPPVVDGTIGATEWANVTARPILLVGQKDARFFQPFVLRASNDARNLYVAIEGRTDSIEKERETDVLRIEVDGGRGLVPWRDGRTGVDFTDINLTSPLCRWYDGHFTASRSLVRENGNDNDAIVACSTVLEDGSFTLEIVKPLREQYPPDAGDLALPYDAALGYLAKELGLRIEFKETTAGETFAWPAGTTDKDGANGYRIDANLSDEMTDWAVAGLANLGADAAEPLVTKRPAVAQGAAISGVGILAMLGTTASDATYTASDMSQGYGAYGGLGLLLDAGGSDRYVARKLAQGAAGVQAIGVLLDADGNDNYRSVNASLGYTVDVASFALFVDLNGFDEYASGTPGRDARSAVDSTSTPLGPLYMWKGGSGTGIDYLTRDDARGKAWSAAIDPLWSRDRTVLALHRVTPSGACGEPVPMRTVGPGVQRPVITGEVCLVAQVDLTRGNDEAGVVTVDGVDFLLDGIRIASERVPVTGTMRRPLFETKVNFSSFDDGVATLTALSILRVQQEGRGAVVFYDQPTTQDGGTNSLASLRALINNPTRASVCTLPKLNVPAEFAGNECASDVPAVFSPVAANLTVNTDRLGVRWQVTHDAFEDRYDVVHNWAPNDSVRNFPCAPNDARLCNYLPFYLSKDTDPWGTDPVDYEAYDPNAAFRQAEGSNPYFHDTPVLKTNLTVLKKNGLHLALDQHLNLLSGEYNTSIILTLLDPAGKPVRVTVGDDERIVTFVNSTLNATRGTDLSALPSDTYREAVRNAVDNVSSRRDVIVQGYVAYAARTIDTQCRPGGVLSGVSPQNTCWQLWGNPGVGTVASNPDGVVRPCRMDPIPKAARDALPPEQGAEVNATNDELKRSRDQIPGCKPSLLDIINATAPSIDGPVQGVVGEVFDSAEEQLRGLVPPEGEAAGKNWTDYWVDLEDIPEGTPGLIDDGETVTVQAGYKFKVEVYLTSTNVVSELVKEVAAATNLSQTWRNGTGPVPGPKPVVTDAINSTPNTPVCPSQAAPACRFVNTTDDTVYNQFNTTNGSIERNLGGGIPIPVPIAFFQMGSSHLDFLVPTEPRTEATLTVERVVTNETVRTLVPTTLVEGDVAGSPTILGGKSYLGETVWTPGAGLRFTERLFPFDGTDDGGAPLPDGLYRARLVAKDDSTNVEDTAAQTFLLDQTPPVSGVQSRGFAGRALLASSGGSALPVTWGVDEGGSGLRHVWLWYKIGGDDVGNASKWTRVGPFPEGISTYFLSDLRSTVPDYYFITVAEDRAGNIEHQARVREMRGPGDEDNDFTEDAFRAKLADGLWTQITVDAGSPVLGAAPSVDGARQIYFKGVDTQFVRAGAPFTAAVCVRDPEHGIDLVQFVFDYVDPVTSEVVARVFDGAVGGACGDRGTEYRFSGWGAVNANKTLYPDGAWDVSADVIDLAGNRIQVPIASVILDSVAPQVRIETPTYPGGQSAAKPGDSVVVRVFAEDAYGVNEGAIRFDASTLSKAGTLTARPSRIDGAVYHVTNFTADKPNLENGLYEVTVTVPDNAGNLFTGKILVAIDLKRFTIPPTSVVALNATHDSVLLRWTTTEPTTSMVQFDTQPRNPLKGRTAVNTTLTTDHEVLVEGLAASTRYYLRAVSSTAGGFTNESDVVEVVTQSALFLDPISPPAGAAVSGPVEIRFKGGLQGSSGFVTYTLDAQSAPDQPWQFVTTLTAQGDEHALVFNSTRYLDAAAYRLRVTAEAGKNVKTITFGPLLSDNTPPEITVFGPLVATNDTTPSVSAEARDNLALFGSEAATLLVDGKPVEGALAVEPSGQAVQVKYDVPSALSPGVHSFELRVVDRAGNVAVESWRVSIDGEAPLVKVESPRYSPGPAAAKLGGTVTLNLTITDASGVATAVADTTGIGADASTTLRRAAGTDTWVGTFTVAARDDNAQRTLFITVTDLAGNTRVASATVTIDNAKPIVSDVRTTDVGKIRAVLATEASEPVLLVGTATAPNSPTVSAATTTLTARPTLAFEGLLPSRDYAFQLQALDRAGNAVDLSGRFQTEADLVPPGAVRTLSVIDLLDGTLRLSWSEATDDVGVAYYRLYRSDDGATFRPVAEVRGTTYDDRQLPLEKAFTYQVVAVDHGGNEGPASDRLTAAATAIPRLVTGSVTPSVGGATTIFRYTVTYISPGGVQPTYVRVLIDGAPQDMEHAGGGLYVYETRLAPHKRDAPHTYSFEASDGRYTARFPEDGSSLRGPLVSGDALAADASGIGFAKRVPVLGIVGTATAISLAAAAVVIFRRRGPK